MSYSILENRYALENIGLKIWCPSVESVERQTIRHFQTLVEVSPH